MKYVASFRVTPRNWARRHPPETRPYQCRQHQQRNCSLVQVATTVLADRGEIVTILRSPTCAVDVLSCRMWWVPVSVRRWRLRA